MKKLGKLLRKWMSKRKVKLMKSIKDMKNKRKAKRLKRKRICKKYLRKSKYNNKACHL
jgi:hypothetical protein